MLLRLRRLWFALVVLSLTFGCGMNPPPVMDDAGTTEDAGVTDAGHSDAGVTDSGIPDAGQPDAGPVDSGTPDAGQPDAGSIDSGTADAGPEDAGSLDAGEVDAGPADAGPPDAGPPDAGPVCSRCMTYAPIVNAGVVANTALTEISGIAASRQHANVLYAHNDSGGAASVYAMTLQGQTLGEYQLANATNFDWEDMSLGPCPGGTCIYLADIGDNGAVRTSVFLYRFLEPTTPPSGVTTVTWERFELVYDQSLKTDAESFMVHPITGTIYIVTKKQLGQKSAVYKATTLDPLGITTLTKVVDLQIPDPIRVELPLTSGAFDPCGTSVLIRGYGNVYQLTSTGPNPDTIFSATPVRLSAPPFNSSASGELQGEAITWLPGGGYVTVSEGASATLHHVACQ